MSKIIRIENAIHQSFNIMYEWFPSGGRWRTLSSGILWRNRGYTSPWYSVGDAFTYNLNLCDFEEHSWGLRLNEFGDFWGENDAGNGLLNDGGAVGIQSGVIRWEVVKMPED